MFLAGFTEHQAVKTLDSANFSHWGGWWCAAGYEGGRAQTHREFLLTLIVLVDAHDPDIPAGGGQGSW